MANVAIKDLRNQNVGELALDDAVFGEKPKRHVVYEEIKSFRAANRAGTHATKTRGDVSGGGKKPWKQKGTGRARHGSTRSPIWRTGGISHGPHPHTYDLKTNRKAKRLAMRVALSEKLRAEAIVFVDAIELAEPKTKVIAAMLKSLGIARSALIVDGLENKNLHLASRNHPRVNVVAPSALSVYDVLRADRLVLTRESTVKLQEMFRP